MSVIACAVGWVGAFAGLRCGSNRLLVTKPSMKNLLNRCAMALLAFVALFVGSVAHAQSGADPTQLYSGLTSPFNAALTISLGFIGTLLVIRWIVRAIRAR